LPIADSVWSSAFTRFRLLSLAPGFSPVFAVGANGNRFNGFPICTASSAHRREQTVETVFELRADADTQLKPGANEIELCVSIRG